MYIRKLKLYGKRLLPVRLGLPLKRKPGQGMRWLPLRRILARQEMKCRFRRCPLPAKP